MPAATDLDDAAGQAPADMELLWQADTLRADVIAFWTAALAAVPITGPNNAPLANWCAVIAAFAPSILPYESPASGFPNPGEGGIAQSTLDTYQTAVDYVYRLCKLAAYLQAQGLISGAQAAALLAAYNDNLASP